MRYKRFTWVFTYSIYYCWPIVTKIVFGQQLLVKIPSTKFNKNPTNGSAAVSCRQTDRQTDRYDILTFCSC